MICVEESKCIQCGSCLTACPFSVLEMKDVPVANPDRICISCMHCAAVCPTNAITLDGKEGILPEPLRQLPETFAGDLEQFLLQRRSIRSFTEEHVNHNILEHALEIANWGNSAKNQKPTHWIVIDSRKELDVILGHILAFVDKTGICPEIKELCALGKNPVFGNAQTVILGYCDKNAINPTADTAIALTYLELYFQSIGISTCWAGYLTRLANNIPELVEYFQLPEHHAFFGGIFLGYADTSKEDYLHVPQRMKKANVTWMD
ncbi:nitroreductase family protein [Chakrabartyella piscis]|uniref:nitroreductase family protein n=1 Tax=Chakrabartyella piscis TaxID=2918914 RepID=UPI002958B4F0|nr:nitroreductase family protein [Chakrabartyella piscis]